MEVATMAPRVQVMRSNGAAIPEPPDDLDVFMALLENAFTEMCARRIGSLRDIQTHGFGEIQAEWKYENGRFVLTHFNVGTKHKEVA